VHAVVAALAVAAAHGLRLPLVYNTGGYDAVETLRELHSIVDIYMPDVKYADDETGKLLSGVPDYATVARRAVAEMHAQVGDLRTDENGVAFQGLLVRHLVLPNDIAGSEEVMRFLASLSRDTYVNVMGQYRPMHMARDYPELRRRILPHEYRQAVQAARNAGLRHAGQ
jgi:putative pyruvate formate lyase activating enzyme